MSRDIYSPSLPVPGPGLFPTTHGVIVRAANACCIISRVYSVSSRGTMSVNDRRASSMSVPRPRVGSSRSVSDAQKASAFRGASPLQQQQQDHYNMEQMRASSASQKSKMPRDQVISEKRTERTTIHTREKTRPRKRNSMKDSNSAGNRGDLERSRSKRTSHTDVDSPAVRKPEKPKEPEGQC